MKTEGEFRAIVAGEQAAIRRLTVALVVLVTIAAASATSLIVVFCRWVAR